MYTLLDLFNFACAGSSCLHAGFQSKDSSLVRCSSSFSLRWLLLLQITGPRPTAFSSCGKWAQLLCGTWNLPGPGIEPVSPALAAGFLSTEPPGKAFLNVWLEEPNLRIKKARQWRGQRDAMGDDVTKQGQGGGGERKTHPCLSPAPSLQPRREE